jgi:glutathione S-transferase
MSVIKLGETVIAQEQKENIFASLTDMEGFLEGQEWFSANDDVSIADLSILPTFSTIFHLGVEVNNYPNLTAWYERCSALPGFAENEEGAKMLAGYISSKLTEPF